MSNQSQFASPINWGKEPTITKHLLEQSQSEEATRALLRIDAEYQQKRQELDNIQLEQDGNFMMGKLDFGYGEKEDKAYWMSKKHADTLLYDHYMNEAEKTFNHHHPEQENEQEEIFNDNDKDVSEYIKSYNDGYTLFHENAELCKKLNIAIIKREETIKKVEEIIENKRTIITQKDEGMKDGSGKASTEVSIEEHNSIETRTIENSRDITQSIELDNTPDKEID